MVDVSSLTHDTHEVVKTVPKVRAKGDPRDDDFVIKYERANFTDNQNGSAYSDAFQMLSVLVGMFAFTMKEKWACWMSLFLFFTSLVNARSEGRLQQLFTGFSIILISFVNIYFTPQRPLSGPVAAELPS